MQNMKELNIDELFEKAGIYADEEKYDEAINIYLHILISPLNKVFSYNIKLKYLIF